MKRALLLTTLAMVTAMVFAPVALAVTKQCSEVPCLGTGRDDVLTERPGDGTNDVIRGRGGNDTIRANRFGNDRDILYGGEGRDRLNAQDGDGRDFLYGGPGFDICYVDEGDPYVSCEKVALAIE